MLKSFSSLFLILITTTLDSQVIITSTDMPQTSHSYFSQNVLDFITIDLSLTGPNSTWDYSSLVGVDLDTLYAAPVSSTPLAYQFYFNNVFLYPDYVANYAVPTDDIGATGVSLSDRFEYFKSDANGHKIVGFGANVQGIPTSVRYAVIDKIYHFPMAYGDTGTSYGEYLLSIPTFGAYGQWITRTQNVDGWGTLLTPGGSYDCLRVKTVLELTDTVYADFAGFGSSFNRPTDTIFDWITNGEGIPVLTATSGDLGITSAKFKVGEINVINEQSHQPVKLFPNPANQILYIETDRDGFLTVYDLSGNIILEKRYTAFEKIDVSQLACGVYQLSLTDLSGEKVSRKITVIR
ncbi:T9SS type A sorting domain-containing protein [Flavobacteriales bacterium]|nr:T9SS type A sorting domain-containing protein [Flavobacteriales bacterium]